MSKLISITVLLISAVNACNYIAVNYQAIQLDACSSHANAVEGTRDAFSRIYGCIVNSTTGEMEAQDFYWEGSDSCGVDEGDIEPDVAGQEIYDCYPDGDIPCFCEADPAECNIATKTTYGGLPKACDETSIEVKQYVLDVCIPGNSDTYIKSRIIECVEGGTKIRNKVFSTNDCQGDFVYNYDDIDEDTCYVIECDSYVSESSFAFKLSLNIPYIIMIIFAAKLL